MLTCPGLIEEEEVEEEVEAAVVAVEDITGGGVLPPDTFGSESLKTAVLLLVDTNREGNSADVARLCKVLPSMGYGNIIQRKDPTKQDMIDAIQGLAQIKQEQKSLLVVISCHGKISMQKRKGLNLVGSCRGYVTLEELQGEASSAPAFRKCPKIFITNCCRGDHQIQTDGDDFQFRNIATDVYTSYATVEGYTAARHVENGSFYIQTLADVLDHRWHNSSIDDLMVNVRSSLLSNYEESQVCESISSLTSGTISGMYTDLEKPKVDYKNVGIKEKKLAVLFMVNAKDRRDELKRLQNLLPKLGYEVRTCVDPDFEKPSYELFDKTLAAIKFTKESYHGLLIVISCKSCEHGDFKLKDETVSIRYIQTQINSKNAKPFRGKPKLLLVDADRGDDEFEELEIDPKVQHDGGSTDKLVNVETDFYTSYSNVNRYGTYEESVFLESICDVWQENYFNSSIDDLMIRVRRDLLTKTNGQQLCQTYSTLTRNVVGGVYRDVPVLNA